MTRLQERNQSLPNKVTSNIAQEQNPIYFAKPVATPATVYFSITIL